MTGIGPSNCTFTYTQDVLVTATKIAARCRCRYGNTLVIFKGGCYWLLFSTTKSSFEFWLHHDIISSILNGQCSPIGHIQRPFLHLYPLIYTNMD